MIRVTNHKVTTVKRRMQLVSQTCTCCRMSHHLLTREDNPELLRGMPVSLQ